MGLGEGGRKKDLRGHLVGSPFHRNLGEAVEGFLSRAHIRLPDAATTPATPEGAEAASSTPTPEHPLTTYSATPVKCSQRAQVLSPRSQHWPLMRERTDLDEEEQAQLDRLLTVSPEVQTVHTLLHTFLSLVRERKHQHLRSWMEEASKSEIAELKSFVAGVEWDYDAVKEALRLPWSHDYVA